MKKRGLFLGITGITIGVAIGISIVQSKRIIARELIAMLGDEVRASTPCDFKTGPIHLSYLTLKAWTPRPRIVCSGKTVLEFERIEADFSIKQIFKRHILLNHLNLVNGIAHGVSEDSPTYKFIDHLTAPLPPEKQTPDRWRLLLIALTVENSKFIEDGEHTQVLGEGVELFVIRDANDDFVLHPSIKALKLVMKPNKKRPAAETLLLGEAHGILTIKDVQDLVDLKNVTLKLNESLIKADGVADINKDNALGGTFNMDTHEDFLRLTSILTTHLTGNGTLSGTLGNPGMSGEFTQTENTESLVPVVGENQVAFTDVHGKFNADFNHGNPTVKVSELKAESEISKASLAKPIRIIDGNLTGQIAIQVGSYSMLNMELINSDLVLTLGGDLDEPILDAKGKIGQIKTIGMTAEDVQASLHRTDSQLQIDLLSAQSNGGSAKVNGTIDLVHPTTPESMKFTLTADSFNPFPGVKTAAGPLVRLNGSASLMGPAQGEELTSKGLFNALITSGQGTMNLNATIEMAKKKLHLQSQNEQGTLTGALDLTFSDDKTNGKFTWSGKQLELAPFANALKCSTASLNGEYNFSSDNWPAARGSMAISEFLFGCTPFQLALSEPLTMQISGDTLSIPKTKLGGEDTSLSLSGTASVSKGYALDLSGLVELQSFLAALPSVDDLDGAIEGKLSIEGTIAEPQVFGDAEIKEGALTFEAGNLSAEDVQGKLDFDGNEITLHDIHGSLNGGEFSATGRTSLSALINPEIEFQFKDVLIEPMSDTSLVLTSDIKLTTSENGRPRISGTVDVEQGELRRELNVRALVRALSGYLLKASGSQISLPLPSIDLDLKISASRNLFVLSNLLQAELRGNLQVAGSLDSPRISGALETLSGWFAINDRRFDITSGVLTFKPGALLPELSLIGESVMFAPNGETISVLVEARGPITHPELLLSSNKGLTHREILDLLASSAQAATRDGVLQDVARDVGIDRISLVDEPDEDERLARFLNKLASIDSLSLRPEFNPRTGLIEPTIVARKNLTDGLYLEGRGFLAGNLNESRLELAYNLTQKLRVSGLADSTTTRERTALGADLTYTILERGERYLKIAMTGNETYSQQTILSTVRLTEDSRIPIQELDEVKRSIENYYKQRGFFEVEAPVTNLAGKDYARHIQISISEGPRRIIKSVRVDGDPIPEFIDFKDIEDIALDEPAATRVEKKVTSRLIKSLRNEGYIGARVSADLQPLPDGERELVIRLMLGRATSFIFRGNKAFSVNDFLETINLFKRKQPFGNNTIRILVDNIERLYRQAGYLFAVIRYQEEKDPVNDRMTYIIEIDEQEPVAVSRVVLHGNDSISADKLRELIRLRDERAEKRIFQPQYAVAEELQANADLLGVIYHDSGFPEVKITTRLIQETEASGLQVHYDIVEGPSLYTHKLLVEGIPDDVQSIAVPEPPYSIPVTNHYLEELSDTLKRSGFLSSGLSTTLDTASDAMIVRVDMGTPTAIESIAIQGNVAVNSNRIIEIAGLKIGERWDDTRLKDVRQKLYKLGLFSNVQVEPLDGALDSEHEALVVRVAERPLQTLEAGGGVNSELGFHLFGDATDHSIFRDGKSLGLRLDAYYDPTEDDISQGVGTLRYADPSFLSSDYGFASDLRYQKFDNSTLEFDLDRVMLETGWYRQLDHGLSYSFGHVILQENLDNVPSDVILSSLDTGTVNLSYLNAAINFDQRDSAVNPSKGYFTRLSSTLASDSIGSDANYFAAGGRFSFLVPLFNHNLTLANRSEAHSAWAFSDTEEIPISQRYYLGGRTTIRGFRENSLGPRGSDGHIIGGDLLVANNFELQYPISESFSLHAFLDAGTVYLKDEPIRGEDLRFSTGLGFRYLSPIGPIGIDVGHPLDEKEGEPSLRTHFSIGSLF